MGCRSHTATLASLYAPDSRTDIDGSQHPALRLRSGMDQRRLDPQERTEAEWSTLKDFRTRYYGRADTRP